jgi:hypothetical protein
VCFSGDRDEGGVARLLLPTGATEAELSITAGEGPVGVSCAVGAGEGSSRGRISMGPVLDGRVCCCDEGPAGPGMGKGNG